METIEQKLDRLAEYHSQKDSIEARKRALLDEVKIPDEVIDIQRQAAEAMKLRIDIMDELLQKIRIETQAQLDEIQIPADVCAVLAEIDRKRAEISQKRDERQAKAASAVAQFRLENQAWLEAQTRQVYADIETKKREISAEFAGKERDADSNIAALEAEIRDDVKNSKKTAKGQFFMAVYNKGRVSWNTDMLDGMIAIMPQLEKARKEGEPSITLRRI